MLLFECKHSANPSPYPSPLVGEGKGEGGSFFNFTPTPASSAGQALILPHYPNTLKGTSGHKQRGGDRESEYLPLPVGEGRGEGFSFTECLHLNRGKFKRSEKGVTENKREDNG